MLEIQEIITEGHRMAALTINPGQPGVPVVLIHGVVDSIYFWQRGPAAPFIPFGPCISLSLPGHYPAVFPPHLHPDDLTAELIARLTADSIRHLNGGQPVLLAGHSTGAFAALATAAAYPDLVCGVVSISGFAVGRWSGVLSAAQWIACHEPFGRAAFRLLFGIGGHPALFNLTARLHTPDPKAQNGGPALPPPAQNSYQAFCSLSRDSMQAYFAAMRLIDIRPWLGSIRAPTLVIAGAHDLTVPPVQSRLIAAAIPGAESRLIPKGSHHPFFTHPAAYLTVVQDWLERNFPQTGAPPTLPGITG